MAIECRGIEPCGFPEKTLVAYGDGINALLSARCFYFLRLAESATGSARLRRPSPAPKEQITSAICFCFMAKKCRGIEMVQHRHNAMRKMLTGTKQNPGVFRLEHLPGFYLYRVSCFLIRKGKLSLQQYYFLIA